MSLPRVRPTSVFHGNDSICHSYDPTDTTSPVANSTSQQCTRCHGRRNHRRTNTDAHYGRTDANVRGDPDVETSRQKPESDRPPTPMPRSLHDSPCYADTGGSRLKSAITAHTASYLANDASTRREPLNVPLAW